MPYYNLIQSEIQDYEEFKKKYFVLTNKSYKKAKELSAVAE